MQARTTLILLLTAASLGLVVLLPRTPLVLGWLWQQADRIATGQGLELSVSSLDGNAWGGVTLHGPRVRGRGIDLAAREARLEYGLLSLLRGSLSLSLELEGVSGTVDPRELKRGGGGAVPLDLHNLSVSDVNIRIAEYDLILPEFEISGVQAETVSGALRFSGQLLTPEGGAAVAGVWDLADGELQANVTDADVRLARYWWDGIDAGLFSGSVTVTERGVEVDGFVRDGAISVLETQVTGIHGPATMKDLVVRGELAGTGLGGPVGASISVDIMGEQYRGSLKGSPDLQEAVAWLGASTGTDLSGITADGPMSMQAVVGGWEEAEMTGSASAAGLLAGLPLERLHGEFSFLPATGTAVQAEGVLAGGNVVLRLDPLRPGASDLSVSVAGLETGGFRADGSAAVQFRLPGEPVTSSISATVNTEAAGLPLRLTAEGNSDDNLRWPVTLEGGAEDGGTVAGSVLLDLGTDSVDGELTASGLQLEGFPWPLAGTVRVTGARPALPVPLEAELTLGPLAAREQLLLDDADGLSISGEHVSFTDTGGTVSGLPLELALPGRPALGLKLDAATEPGGSFRGSLNGGGLELAAAAADGQSDLRLHGTGGTARLILDQASGEWQLDGALPLTALAELLGVEARGSLPLDLQGRGAEVLSGSAGGELELLGQPLTVAISAADGAVQLEGSAVAGGVDWSLHGSWSPGGVPQLAAESGLGSFAFSDGQLTGTGAIPLPAGVTIPAADGGIPAASVPFTVSGNPAGGLDISIPGAGAVSVTFRDGPELAGALSLPLLVGGTPFRLEAEGRPGGGVGGNVSGGGGQLGFSTEADFSRLTADGTLPAALIAPQLGGLIEVAGSVALADGETGADFSWSGLTGRLSWQPGGQPLVEATGPGLALAFSDGQLEATLAAFDAGPYLAAADGVELLLDGNVSGRLAPELAVTFDAALPAAGISASGTAAGSAADPELSARLQADGRAVPGLLEIAPLQLELARHAGGPYRLSGTGTDVVFDNGGWEGEATLPFGLAGYGHELSAVFSGSGTAPVVTGTLAGPLLNGNVLFDSQLTAELSLNGTAADVPVRALLTGTLGTDGQWRARLDAGLDSPVPLLTPLTAGAELSGTLREATGRGNIRAGADGLRLLSFSVAAAATGLELTADLASLDTTALLGAAGVTDGELTLNGNAGLSVAAGREPVVTLAAQATGRVGPTRFEATAGFTDGVLEASGQAAGEPLSLRFDTATAALEAAWADLRLQVESAAGEYRGRLSGGGTTAATFPADLSFAVVPGTEPHLRTLTGTTGPLSLDLRGTPAEGASGELQVAGLGQSLPLSVSLSPRFSARAAWAGLTLDAQLDENGPVLALHGAHDAIPVSADLTWRPGSGFSGTVHGSGSVTAGQSNLPWQASATGEADGSLAVTAELRQPEGQARAPLAELRARLGADPFARDALSGMLNAHLNTAALFAAPAGINVALSAHARLAGSLNAPVAMGSVALAGALEAEGRLQADAGGASFSLEGPRTDVQLRIDSASWAGHARLGPLPLPELAAVWPEAELAAALEGSGNFRERNHRLDLSSLTLSGSGSCLTATATLAGGVIDGSADVQLDGGRLTGSPLLADSSATGTVRFTEIQPAEPGVGRIDGELALSVAGLSGHVRLSGPPADLRASAQLDDGTGQGNISADWRPAGGRLRFSAILEREGISSDLLLVLEDNTIVTATGSIAAAGGQLRLRAGEGGQLHLDGGGALAGWEAAINPRAATATAEGELGTIHDALAGRLTLTASLREGRPVLTGSIAELALFGTDLGTVDISERSANGGGVRLTGPALQARLLPDGDWQVARLALDLTPGVRLVASGTGNLSGGSLDVSVGGDLLGKPLSGTLHAEAHSGGMEVSGHAEALAGGSGSLQASLSGGQWRGSVNLADLTYGSLGLSATGSLFGAALEPRLELQTDSRFLSLTGEGSVKAGPGLLSFHQVFSSSETGTFTVQGSGWPEFALRLSGPDGHTFRLLETAEDGRLEAQGSFHLGSEAGALELEAAPDGTAAGLYLELGLLSGLAVEGSVPTGSFAALLAGLGDGIELQGRRETFGSLRLDLPQGRLELEEFGLGNELGRVVLSGNIGLDGQARLSGQLTPEAAWLRDLPVLSGEVTVPFAIVSSGGTVRFVSYSRLGDVEARYGRASGQAELSGIFSSGSGHTNLGLAWSEANGLSGWFDSDAFVLFELPGGTPAILSGRAELDDGLLDLDGGLTAGTGELSARGDLNLSRYLPAWLAGPPRAGGNLDLRVSALELGGFPPLARVAPELAGTVTAAVHVRDDVIAGNIVARDLRSASTPLPLEAVISGGPAGIAIAGNMAGSPVTARLEGGALSGLFELRRFPLEALLEAVAGPLDASAGVTGVLRYRLPLGNPAASELRLATEQVVLERAGVESTGALSLELSDGVLQVHEASFRGAGTWEAAGVMGADLLDFRLEAVDADFGLLLGLVPGLSSMGVTASGSLSLQAGGSLREPRFNVDSAGVDFGLAGISYRLEELDVDLSNSRLNMVAQASALEPFSARLRLHGSALLSTAPFGLKDAAFELNGSAVLPVIGAVEGISGTFSSADGTPGAPLLADVRARFGQEVRLSGSVWPLDLRLQGSSLQLSLPALLLAESRLDLDLHLRDEDGPVLGGDVLIHEGVLRLGGAFGGDGAAGFSAGDALRFGDLRVRAPARLRLSENFMNVELSADLLVGGTMADPTLSGRADALRGTLQFSGRTFELQEASAQFDPSRGIYPGLRFSAVTTFDRGRLLPAGSNLQLAGPTDGPATVNLSFNGTVEPDPVRGIRLDLVPVLSSNITVQALRSDGVTTGPRGLSSDELLALVTLGRAELAALGGESGLAPLVAQGALETAVDVFILGELQQALGEALGLDLVEIRSSTLSNLLSGNGEDSQFGISLRLGGYLTDEVFATYSVSAFDDPLGLYAFSNEVGIRYALGPVLLDLAGGLKVPDQPGLPAVAQLSFGVDYELDSGTLLRAGFDLSGESQQFSFGVTWRW